jgi:glyoxylase-like metal-dependent hydrolase (beta-lactamase superfamily II)
MLIRTNRRAIAVLAALLFASAWVMAYSAAPLAGAQAPGFYRFMLGDYEITVVSDGTTLRRFDEIMSDGARIREVFAKDHENLPAEMSINTFLINTGKELVLIDSGAGALLGPTLSGKLAANLRASGYQPEQIDAVLLTHLHPDHEGGLTLDGQRQFPNALVYASKRDTDFWLSPDAATAAPENRKTMFQQAHLVVDPYVSADKLRPFDGATELFPGIRSLPSKGHTPGHTSYLVQSKGQQLLLWGFM